MPRKKKPKAKNLSFGSLRLCPTERSSKKNLDQADIDQVISIILGTCYNKNGEMIPSRGTLSGIARSFNVHPATITRIWNTAKANMNDASIGTYSCPIMKKGDNMMRLKYDREALKAEIRAMPVSDRSLPFAGLASKLQIPKTTVFRLYQQEGLFKRRSVRAKPFLNEENELAPTEGESNDSGNVYENDNNLHMYLGLHYSASGAKENIPQILPHNHSPVHGLNFPQRVANILSNLKPIQCNNHALDVGCAVGGASFELAKLFDHVDAFDLSSSFIKAAQRMQNNPENVSFRIPIEAEIYQDVNAIHSNGVTSEVRSKVCFFTGDACNMTQMVDDGLLKTYDGIIMSNLLCRLPDPVACLNNLPGLVNPGGVVVIVTPFSWLTEFTPRSKWLAGFLDPVTNKLINSKDVLLQLMESRGFEKIYEEEIPHVIRENQRKYQYIISLATGWRKIV